MPAAAVIMVVDDDPAIREVLATQLARLGYEPVVAEDGEEAVALFKKKRPNLVLMDMVMPRLDGLKACQRMRALEKNGARTPILFLTARDGHQDKLSSALSGGDDFISKPISLQELRERVEEALAKARAVPARKPRARRA